MLWRRHHLIPSSYATCHGPHQEHYRDVSSMNLYLRLTGAEPAARAVGTVASALQFDAAGLVAGEPGTSGAAAASTERDGAATGMAALHDAGGDPAAAGAAWLAGADSPAERTGQGSRPLRLSSAGDVASLPVAQAASPQPYVLPDDWGGGGAPSPELEPASARGLGGQGGAGAPPAPAPRCASPSAPAKDSSASAGPSGPEGASGGAAKPAGSSDPVPQLAGPAGHAQTRSCQQAGEGSSARSSGAAQRSPRCQPAPGAGVAFQRIMLPKSSDSGGDGPGLDAAPAGAAAGLGSVPQRRPVERSTSVYFERMALPDLSDSDREGVDELTCLRPEPPAEPGCDGPHRGVVSSAPITFNRMALPDSSDSDGEGGTGPAQTGDPGSARAHERAQLRDPSIKLRTAGEELQSSAGGHAGSRAAEGPVRDGAAVAPAASGSPATPYRPSTGAAAPHAAAASARQQVAFKRVRMAESSDESEGGREGSRSGSKRVRRCPSEGCAHLRPAKGSGQAAESGLALARQAAPGDSSAAACSGAHAAASCGRGPGGGAVLEVVARNDTELYVDGKLTRWTKVCDCLHSACIVSLRAISVHLACTPCPRTQNQGTVNCGAPRIHSQHPACSSSSLSRRMHPAVHERRLLIILPGQVMHLLCVSAAGG